MGSLIFLSIIAVALATLTTWICELARTGSLDLNSAVGLRTPATKRSEAAWTAGHAAAVRPATATAAIVVIVSILSILGVLLLNNDNAADILAWAPMIAMFVGLIVTTVTANRAAKEAKEDRSDKLAA